MSGNYEKPVALENQNQGKLDAILNELQTIQGKLKRLEELTHTKGEDVQTPENKFVLRHVFKFSELKASGRQYESCHEEHFNASWFLKVFKNGNSLSFYTYCTELENKTKWSVEISQEVRLIHSRGSPARKLCQRYCIREFRCFIWSNIIDLNDLENLYVENDEFILEMHVTIIKTFKAYNQILRSFNDKDLSDVALLVNEKKFYVSKLFLASQSNYFKALFLGNFEESKKSQVKLCGVDENDMQKFLEVLYGENAIDDMTVEGVLFLSDMYGSSLATQKCVSFLMKDSKKSLENKLILAGKYNLEELKQQCFDKITTLEHVRSLIHGRHDMHQSILAVLLEKSLSLR